MKNLMRDIKNRVRIFHPDMRSLVYTLLVMFAATMVSAVLHRFFIQNNNVSIIYTLAVVVVACITPDYFYGIIASLISVVGVNYFFTAPYWAFDFSQTGYPITFLTLLIASIITSTLVTGYRERDRVMLEAENEKLRANLLRAISHDLRTPLTSISGASVAMLEDANMDEASRQALLSDIHDNSEWLIRMVENLLSVTRMRGEASIQKTAEMAEEIVAQAVSQIRRRFPAQHIEVSVPDEPLVVEMDGTLIGQVLINLMENAIYHSESREPIRVRVEAGTDAVFTVRDYGKGIDPQLIHRLFDGYIDPNRTGDQGRGMGIGLSICAAIIRAHGGEIQASNAPDGGACFNFTLPISDISAEDGE